MRVLLLTIACCGCGTNAVEAGDLGSSDGSVAQSDGSVMTSDGGMTTGCLASQLTTALGKDRLMIGLAGDDTAAKKAPFDLRYLYLSGGFFDGNAPCASCASACTADAKSCANNGPGCAWWGCWQYDQVPPGAYVRDFVTKATTDGQIPMITYYEVLQASKAMEGAPEVMATTNVALMTRWYADFRFMLQQIGTAKALVHVEPDFWGYAQQLDSDPAQINAAVASANATDCAAEANTLAGLGRCLVTMTHKYAPNAKLGLHASGWSTKMDVLMNKSTTLDPAAHAKQTADYLNAAAPGADFVVVDWSDRDAGFYQANGRDSWWDATDAKLPHFKQALAWTKAVGASANKPVLIWQIPVGNMSLPDTCDRYKDNRVDYLFAHLGEVAAAHVAGLAFGAGAGCNTTPSTDGDNLIDKTKAYSAAGGQKPCP
jgi:hypothetical protein